MESRKESFESRRGTVKVHADGISWTVITVGSGFNPEGIVRSEKVERWQILPLPPRLIRGPLVQVLVRASEGLRWLGEQPMRPVVVSLLTSPESARSLTEAARRVLPAEVFAEEE